MPSRSAIRWLALGAMVCWFLWCAPSFVWAQDPSTPPLDWLGETIERRGLWLGLVAVFAAGFALNLTPCVYPLIPVTLAFFSRQTAQRRLPAAWLAAAYVLGISLSYAVLGVIAAKTGSLLGFWLQQPLVLLATAGMILALAMSMFGVFELTVPQALLRPLSRVSDGIRGAFLMGLGIGLIAAPCIGPFVLGLFVFISQRADVWTGFLIFFTLGLGMGLPYFVLATALGRVARLPKAGAWLVWSKQVLGCVLIGLALYMLKPLLPSGGFSIAIAVLLLAAGVYVGWLARSPEMRRRAVWIRRVAGSVLIASAVSVAWPRTPAVAPVAWVPYSEAAFESAKRAKRPILIDIYADWCLPCVEMDHVTFRHPDVVRALSSVTTLRLDVTDEVSEEGERLIAQYRIYGAPTILLFDRTGKERTALRILGFVDPEEFLQILQQIL